MRLFLARHGQIEGNKEQFLISRTEQPLSEEGKKQAELLGRYLAQFPLDAIYSSGLQRSKETAMYVAKLQKKKVACKSFSEFNERDFGEYEGKKWKEVFGLHSHLRKQWMEEKGNFAFPNGEKLDVFLSRVSLGFQKVLENHSLEENILICGHSGSVKAILAFLFKTPAEYVMELCDQSNCGLNELSYNGKYWAIHRLNFTGYKWYL
ncbi:histidine phosphatase family protein [Candidatus Woesearchaeota archaeon]|nr:histidine phosphatase family protein [Candidatus Woesearchaeota archaeon]